MTDPHITEAFHELVARGLMVAEPVPEDLPIGNQDRNDLAARSSWIVHLTQGGRGKLTLGNDLSDLAARQTALALACPEIVSSPLFHVQLPL